ncbi:Transcriptional regulator, LysR family [Caenispirillum salinarum AK4]|uniref:Transcriptional regulator, LysR family n=1 Tax=Caenispirillum salinarum AK4 TaxID=1238182 RepID=K9H517_9PROT|nr:LysR family transcriptional regulator [Caenispirillum salinarum]EKV32632.1 Transcriptional regulator, LysR family [Caenispirillum salinarum AK4]
MVGDPLEGYATFAAVVDCGGFSAAAERLGVSKSAISKQVSRLEERLGARLLNRTTRRLALTEAGQAFHQHALRILAEAEEAELAVSQLHASPRGLLRVSAPMSFGIKHLGPVLCPFLQRYPDLTLEAAYDDRLVDMVAEGFDVAVRIARLADSSMIARKLAPCRRVVVASPDYVERRGMPMHPAELTGHDTLLYTLQATANIWTLVHADGSRADVSLSGRLRVNNGDALRSAAVAGLGVIITPTFIVGDDLAAGRLVRVLPDWEAEPIHIYAVYPPGRHLSVKVRAFVDFLAEAFGPNPYWDSWDG